MFPSPTLSILKTVPLISHQFTLLVTCVMVSCGLIPAALRCSSGLITLGLPHHRHHHKILSISSALDDISRISGDVTALTQDVTTIENFLETRKSIYYSDSNPTPVGPDGVTSTLKDGDIWIDGNNLELKFYSQGAWINP